MIKFMGHSGFILADTAWEEGLPWLRPGATKFFEERLPKEATVLEWGMGASTVWFAKNGYYVISCELNLDWWFSVSDRLYKEKCRTHAVLKDFHADGIEKYADWILEAEDETFDLVLIDGRNRCRCLGNVRSKVKIGGMLCLDNSERQEYAKAVALMDSWQGFEYGDEGWMSAIFIRLPESEVDRVEFENEDA